MPGKKDEKEEKPIHFKKVAKKLSKKQIKTLQKTIERKKKKASVRKLVVVLK